MPNPARNLARAALASARQSHVDEPTIEYHGRRYGEAELRALQAAGELETLGDLAPGIPGYLRALDVARSPAFGPRYHLGIVEGLDWNDTLPLDADYLLPPGWTLTRYHYTFEDDVFEDEAAPDSHSQDAAAPDRQ